MSGIQTNVAASTLDVLQRFIASDTPKVAQMNTDDGQITQVTSSPDAIPPSYTDPSTLQIVSTHEEAYSTPAGSSR